VQILQKDYGNIIPEKRSLSKPSIPFEIVYTESFATREEAIKRELYFKSAAGRRFLNLKLG